MTNPSDPGQPQRPPAGGHLGEPYGPPPPPHPQQQQQPPPPPPRQGTGPIPVPNPRPPAAPPVQGQGQGYGQQNPNQTGPGPYATGPQPQGWGPQLGEAPRPRDKGLIGALFDTSFDFMITAELIKVVYRLAIVLITLFALVLAWYGVSFLVWNPTLGLVFLIATPIIWVFLLVSTRMTLEFLINQFKISEHLRIIKDKS